jgi:hypothetical protein
VAHTLIVNTLWRKLIVRGSNHWHPKEEEEEENPKTQLYTFHGAKLKENQGPDKFGNL